MSYILKINRCSPSVYLAMVPIARFRQFCYKDPLGSLRFLACAPQPDTVYRCPAARLSFALAFYQEPTRIIV